MLRLLSSFVCSNNSLLYSSDVTSAFALTSFSSFSKALISSFACSVVSFASVRRDRSFPHSSFPSVFSSPLSPLSSKSRCAASPDFWPVSWRPRFRPSESPEKPTKRRDDESRRRGRAQNRRRTDCAEIGKVSCCVAYLPTGRQLWWFPRL